ncbi:MAG: carbohydrate ABC transporter permease, partial [Cyanobacteria bacterium P01_H01_bin.26]
MLTPRRWWEIVLMYALLAGIAIAMLLPLFWLISTAFKSGAENIFEFPPRFLPQQPTFGNFVTVWQTNPFGRYFFNSTLIATA